MTTQQPQLEETPRSVRPSPPGSSSEDAEAARKFDKAVSEAVEIAATMFYSLAYCAALAIIGC